MRRDQLRIDELASRIEKMKGGNDGSDDELEDEEGMNAEIKELAKKQEERQAKVRVGEELGTTAFAGRHSGAL